MPRPERRTPLTRRRDRRSTATERAAPGLRDVGGELVCLRAREHCQRQCWRPGQLSGPWDERADCRHDRLTTPSPPTSRPMSIGILPPCQDILVQVGTISCCDIPTLSHRRAPGRPRPRGPMRERPMPGRVFALTGRVAAQNRGQGTTDHGLPQQRPSSPEGWNACPSPARPTRAHHRNAQMPSPLENRFPAAVTWRRLLLQQGLRSSTCRLAPELPPQVSAVANSSLSCPPL